ncbi:hypothetical protein MWN52_07345 [Pseudoxanthomonas winnipegensis]|uniref:hypothetical protein n=1 Tax=Pseudoxanthomonas winnipegensis TaxID=2480810 RepID=UPI002574B953|nr:hypothetical protein [Pseudoxanthomonas winnipegensis]WJI17063.1 hypothetical protein MWN52_07345 [Pseudoxanthomonas winnipegensis]
MKTLFDHKTKKPKLFWLIVSIALLSLVFGGFGVLLTLLTGGRLLQWLVFVGIVSAWGTGLGLTVFYFFRQILGNYRGIEEKSIRDQMW